MELTLLSFAQCRLLSQGRLRIRFVPSPQQLTQTLCIKVRSRLPLARGELDLGSETTRSGHNVMVDNEDIWLTLYIIVIFVVFISGMFVGALISPRRRKEREPRHARLAAEPSVRSDNQRCHQQRK